MNSDLQQDKHALLSLVVGVEYWHIESHCGHPERNDSIQLSQMHELSGEGMWPS
jgi:hypothetical protein